MVFSFSVEAQTSNTGSGATVAASLTTTEHPDFVGVFVAWSGAVDVSSLADAGHHTWTKKGPTFSVYKVNGVALSLPINVAYFWTIASAALGGGGDAITATFAGAGATHSLLSAFAVSIPNVSLPFDTNVGLGYPSIQGLTSSAAFSVAFSTHLSHFAAIAFTVLFADPGGEDYGAGWTPENKGTAINFGWILESQIFTSIQTSAPASFVTASGNYTAITIVDAIEATDSTAFPFVTLTEGLPIQNDPTSNEPGYSEVEPNTTIAEFGMPQSTLPNTTTRTVPAGVDLDIDQSGNANNTVGQLKKSVKNPMVVIGGETNQFDSTSTVEQLEQSS
jgi:hypothetical protein